MANLLSEHEVATKLETLEHQHAALLATVEKLMARVKTLEDQKAEK